MDLIYLDYNCFQRSSKMTSKDAIHLACAHFIKADYFLSCDDYIRMED